MRRKRSLPASIEKLCTMSHLSEEGIDVLGSYTGTGENGDYPVQDADDL